MISCYPEMVERKWKTERETERQRETFLHVSLVSVGASKGQTGTGGLREKKRGNW